MHTILIHDSCSCSTVLCTDLRHGRPQGAQAGCPHTHMQRQHTRPELYSMYVLTSKWNSIAAVTFRTPLAAGSTGEVESLAAVSMCRRPGASHAALCPALASPPALRVALAPPGEAAVRAAEPRGAAAWLPVARRRARVADASHRHAREGPGRGTGAPLLRMSARQGQPRHGGARRLDRREGGEAVEREARGEGAPHGAERLGHEREGDVAVRRREELGGRCGVEASSDEVLRPRELPGEGGGGGERRRDKRRRRGHTEGAVGSGVESGRQRRRPPVWWHRSSQSRSLRAPGRSRAPAGAAPCPRATCAPSGRWRRSQARHVVCESHRCACS